MRSAWHIRADVTIAQRDTLGQRAIVRLGQHASLGLHAKIRQMSY